MNLPETIQLCAVLSGAIPHQKFDENTPKFWHPVLEDLDYADCIQAAKKLVRTQRFVGLNDICNEVSLIRSDRARKEVRELVPNVDPDRTADYLTEVRAIDAAAANGMLDLDRYRAGGYTVSGVPPWRAQRSVTADADPERLLSVLESGVELPRVPSEEEVRAGTAAERAAWERARAEQLAGLEKIMDDPERPPKREPFIVDPRVALAPRSDADA